MKVRKAVIPVAGLGTRFLPASKAIPKEMLPVVDRPVVQLVVEEARRAGIEDIIFVTGSGKQAIEDHFDVHPWLEHKLEADGKTALLEEVRGVASLVRVNSVRQKVPRGLGHAVLSARALVGDEPFAVLLGDDIIDSEEPAIGEMIRAYQETGKGSVAIMAVPESQVERYGIVVPSEPVPEDLEPPAVIDLKDMVEKPSPDQAPSNLAIIGRYVLPPEIFDELAQERTGKGGEIQITDALSALARRGRMTGFHFEGKRYDAGDKAGFVAANIAWARKDEGFWARVEEVLNQ